MSRLWPTSTLHRQKTNRTEYFVGVSTCGSARFDTFVSDAGGDIFMIMDTGCRGAVAGPRWHHDMQQACETKR
eukprot:1758067-Prorocentrum_lima.AAC.1